MADKNTSNVDLRHPDYRSMSPSWEKMFDVCISEQHVQQRDIAYEGDADHAYVPILDEMTASQYKAYVKRAEFPMFTRHALESFVGMSMRKDLIIEGIDKDHEFFKNIDSKGTKVKDYAENLVEHYLQYRRCGTLVDMPSVDPDASKADAEKQNVKVRFAFYDHAAIINWKVDTTNNAQKLSMVVLEEEVEASEDPYSHNYDKRWRVLRLEDGVYRQEVYDNNKNLVEIYTPTMNGDTLDFIPFIIHGGIKVKSPSMLPIAEQNIHWYMKSADYQHGLHYTALPTPYVTAVDPKDPDAPRTIGPQRIWYLPIGATANMLEFSGAGLGQVALSMNDTLGNIVMLSAQILVPKSAYDESATAANIRGAAETASLTSMVNKLSAEFTTLVEWASEWGGFSTDDVSVKINSDFIPMTLSGADVIAYVQSVVSEGFSKRTLFDLLKRGEIIEGDRQYEEEMADIEEEAKARQARMMAQQKKFSDMTVENNNNLGKEKPNKGSATAAEKEAQR